MSVSREEVFLLSRADYRDFDLVVNFLSRVQGKMSAVIYGGKRINAFSSFPYNPGDLLEIEFVKRENKDFVRVFGTGGIKLLNLEKFSYQRFLFHSYLLEVVSMVSRSEMPAPELFQLLETNHWLEWTPEEALKFMLWAVWQISRQGGYQVGFDSCLECGKTTWQVSADGRAAFRKENYQLMNNEGCLTCSECRPLPKTDVITPAMVKIVKIFESVTDFRDVGETFPKEISAPMLLTLNRYLTRIFEIRPASLSLFLSAAKNIKNQPGEKHAV